MSQQSAEIVRAAAEAFNRDGVDGLIRYCDPTIEWRTTGQFADRGVYRGHAGVRQMLAEFVEDVEQLHVQIDRLWDAEDRVVSSTRVTGRGRRGGAPFESPLCFLWRLEAGKVVEVQHFLGVEEALEAAGLAE
jgi:ketosteroid isomerase-like protein